MPTNRTERSLRATFLGMGVNILLVAGKLAGGFFGHSHALIADAMESLADIISSVIVWRAVVLAAEPPDREHPYGHGKAEAIATAVVSTILLLAALGIAINAGRQVFEPREPPRAFTLYILIGVVVVKELVFRYASQQARLAESGAVKADAWHHRSDAITSLAAAIGISVCLLGGARWVYADDAAALFAAAIIGWNGWLLLRPALDELMDAAPSAVLLAQIRATAAEVAGVQAVEKCQARKTGFQYLVDMHIEVDPEMTVQQGHGIAHQVKSRVREAVPLVNDVLVHVEPGKRGNAECKMQNEE
ncbi:MAG: cation diffusion facilitator family transporter [Verrucomicrobiota bacterium]